MATAPITYSRFPGRASRNFGVLTPERCRLWLGPDHLLHVRTSYFTETCRRLYFKDIQAITVCRTRSGRTMNGVLTAIVTTLGLLAAGLATVSPVGAILAGIVAGIFALFLIGNVLAGPTCACHIHTAVQTERLYSLGRLWTAERALVTLRPLIAAAQGPVAREDLEGDAETPVAVEPSPHARTETGTAPRERRHDSGVLHAALFWLMLAAVPSLLFDVFYDLGVKNGLDTVWFTATLILVVVTVRRQVDSDLPRSIRDMAWIVLIVVICRFVLEATLGFADIFPSMLDQTFRQRGPFELMTRSSTLAFGIYCPVAAVVSAVVGAVGLLRVERRRRYLKQAGDASPAQRS